MTATSPATTGPAREGAAPTGALTSVEVEHLVPMARGAAVLGTGGGGDPYIGRLLAQQAIADHGPVRLARLDELDDDAVVVPVGMMGAPTVMVEKLPTLDQFTDLVRAVTRYLGVEATHLACIEAGGVNSMIPIAAAAELGLPLVDGDGMGRAFPEIQMVLATLEGVSATPMAVADDKGNRVVLDTTDNLWAERLARTATVEMGCSTLMANYVMSGARARSAMLPATLSLCHDLGETLHRARTANEDPVAALTQRLGGRVIGGGKVVDVERRTQTGFARGRAAIAPLGAAEGAGGEDLVLHFQNEHLMATRGGSPVVTTPDLLIAVDDETGEPVTTETLRFGHRVQVIAAPCDERWHSPGGIGLAGPRYFGYDVDPVRWDAPAPGPAAVTGPR